MLTGLAIPTVGTVLLWTISLRRTAQALIWAVLLFFMWDLGLLMVMGAYGVHHTLIGMVAVVMAALVMPSIAVLAVEACAHAGHPGISAYRRPQLRGRSARRRAVRADKWRVRARADNDTTVIYLERGPTQRTFGRVDPIQDMDGFMNLRAQADRAAETLNALKVEA